MATTASTSYLKFVCFRWPDGLGVVARARHATFKDLLETGVDRGVIGCAVFTDVRLALPLNATPVKVWHVEGFTSPMYQAELGWVAQVRLGYRHSWVAKSIRAVGLRFVSEAEDVFSRA